jgi:hypothetical protein
MTYTWGALTPEQIVLAKGLGGDRGVFVRNDMMRACEGDGNVAILLTQLVYWSQSEYASAHDGWFYLTSQKVSQELGMTKKVQQRVRGVLQEYGVLEWDRRGMPAKNYYRVNLIKLAKMVASQYGDLGLPVGTDGVHSDGPKRTNIVNKEVRTFSSDTIVSGSRPQRGRNAKVNVMAEKFDDFLAWIVRTYPISCLGIPATENQARRIAKKLGDVLPSATAEERQKARDDIQEFILALKNLAAEVESGRYETKYVPKFDNFAGLGIQYGKEPTYKAWAKKVKPQEKPRPFVV